MFRQTKQRLAEKLGFRSASTYDVEFERSCVLVENTSVGTAELAAATRDLGAVFWVPDARSKAPEFPTELIGTAASRLAAVLVAFPVLAFLTALAQSSAATVLLQRNLARSLDLDVIARFRDWLNGRDAEYRAVRKKLDGLRLAMDAEKHTAEKRRVSGSDKTRFKATQRAAAAAAEHTDATAAVWDIVSHVQDDHTQHRRILARLARAQRHYHVAARNNAAAALSSLNLGTFEPFNFAAATQHPTL